MENKFMSIAADTFDDAAARAISIFSTHENIEKIFVTWNPTVGGFHSKKIFGERVVILKTAAQKIEISWSN